MNSKNVALAVLSAIILVLVAVFASSEYDRDVNGNQSLVTSTAGTATTGSVQPNDTATTTGQPPSGTVSVTARLGQGVSALNMTVTPLAVVEDSRCPTGVQCIQAGTVRVRVRLSSALGASEQVVALGGTMTTEAESVKLVSVTPYPSSGSQIASADYRFTFEVARR
jgi:hypothetical protein